MGPSYHADKAKQLLEKSIFISKEQGSSLLRTLDNYFHKLLGILGYNQNIRYFFDSFGVSKFVFLLYSIFFRNTYFSTKRIRFELIAQDSKDSKRGYLKNNELVEFIKFDYKGFHWNGLQCFELLEQELEFQKYMLVNKYCRNFEYELERILGHHSFVTFSFSSTSF